jgi:putative NADH-flavin reductase
MSPRSVLVIGGHHGVGALVASSLQARGDDARVFEGDVLDPPALARSMNGVDAVISTLGPNKASPPDLCARGTKNILDAMRAAHVRRIAQVTGAMIGHPHEHLGLVYRLIQRAVGSAALEDRRVQERLVCDSQLDWTLVRPTRLTDGRPAPVLIDDVDERIGAFAKVSREDVAAFLVRAVHDDSTIARAFTLQASRVGVPPSPSERAVQPRAASSSTQGTSSAS